ncbi:MAG: hypothetical protein E7461_05915 [Ruminococcaceae bacterium]|nr:hypothetical protein [Oscillospiraceae bacterium]
MAGLEEQLNAVLSNPQMMQQIMAMAQNFSPPPEAPPPESPPPPPAPELSIPALDPGMLQKLSGLMGQGGIDKNQQHLLRALRPYISQNRVTKLEKAMQAAKMAQLATKLFGNNK